MKICPKCNAQNRDDALFCASCGARFEQAQPQPPQQPAQPQPFQQPAQPQPFQQPIQPAKVQQKPPKAKKPFKVWIIAAVVVAVVAAAAVVGFIVHGRLTATTMSLMKTQGTVDVSNEKGATVTPKENLKLYSGYGVGTAAVSYAWIDLDDVKLIKMDEHSEIDIQKDGKQLEILLTSGSLFFNVTEPLADDETMTIRTSTMMVGIRGTCGWVVSESSRSARVYILEGTVEVKAASTGETAQVSAGEVALLTVNAHGGAEITVLPFAEEYIAPFVQAELEADAALSAAVLDASGLDALDPPDPAERLRAEYEEIAASRAVFDGGTAEGVSYTANGVTYASEGLTDAVCYDLNGDGLEELILITRASDIRYYGFYEPIIRMEVYGASMGRAVLYDSVAFDFPDYRSGDYANSANHFQLAVRDGLPCIYMAFGYTDVAGEFLFALEDHTLTRLERRNGWDYIQDIDRVSDEAITTLELPALPEDSRRKNAYLSIIADAYLSGAIYAELTDIDRDGVDELLVLEYLLGEEDSPYFAVYSWNGAEAQRTEYESNILYAKLIDMDRDGTDELLLITNRSQPVAYSWGGSGIRATALDVTMWASGFDGLYLDNTTGDIYVGSGIENLWNLSNDFASLTNFIGFRWVWPNEYDYDLGSVDEDEYYIYEDRELESMRQVEESEFNSQLGRFELLEYISLGPADWPPAWMDPLSQTVDDAKQQLMAR